MEILYAQRHSDGTAEVHYADGSSAHVAFDQSPPAQALEAYLAAGRPFPAVPPTLDEVKANAVATIIARADAVTARITSRYPAAEVASWPLQLVEARLVQAGQALPDGSALAAIVAASNGAWTLQTLAASVIAKAATYNQIVAAVQALRVQGQTQIAAVQDAGQIQPIMQALADAAAKAAAQLGLPA